MDSYPRESRTVSHAHREPRPPRDRAAVRARPRPRGGRGHARVRLPAGGARAASESRATCCPPGSAPPRSTRRCASGRCAGEAIYELDRGALAALEPDLIVTQALCPVCAVSYEEVAELARGLPSRPRVIALDPHTLGETLGDVRTWPRRPGGRERGVALVARSHRAHRPRRAGRPRAAAPARRRARVARPRLRRGPLDAPADRARRRRGRARLTRRAPRRPSPGRQVAVAAPEVVVVMPCGYDAPRARAEAVAYTSELAALGARADRGRERLRLLLAAGPAADRRPGAARARPPSGVCAQRARCARRGAHGRALRRGAQWQVSCRPSQATSTGATLGRSELWPRG